MILLLRIGKGSLNTNCSLINIILRLLPCLLLPCLIYVGKYLVPLEAIHAYQNPTSATEPESEPQVDPPRQSNYQWDPEMIDNQWQSESSSSQYDPNYNYGYPPGQAWIASNGTRYWPADKSNKEGAGRVIVSG